MSITSPFQTTDALVRRALLDRLACEYPITKYRIVPELGLWHGTVRIDVAVVNGIAHGFEIKSDRDTLGRLDTQMRAYNSVFDKVTLVVGRTHLVQAFQAIPEWWGIETVGVAADGIVIFNKIREGHDNPHQDLTSIVRLLWRNEALDLLEEAGSAAGVRSKPRDAIYQRLIDSFEVNALKERVWHVLQHSRESWRPDAQLA
ncbi:MAG: hypothetical protein JWO97_3880 [Acidobacteria bacterium]|nr:hypothetical protein [Acidobacteriota bacterium]